MSTTTPGAESGPEKTASAQSSKQERLADALRQNLHRRKAQQRARTLGAGQRPSKT